MVQIFGCRPKTNTVEIKSAYFSSDVVLVTMYPEEDPTVSLFPGGTNTSYIYGVYKSEITKSIEYRLVDLLGNYVGNGVKIETGEYIGTGTHGNSDKNTLHFNFTPKIVVVRTSKQSSSHYGFLTLNPIEVTPSAFNFQGSSSSNILHLSWSEKVLKWYGETNTDQLNETGVKYFYAAIG